LTFYNNACAQKQQIALMEREFGPVVVGEWSLATDNCAMWLNGFNGKVTVHITHAIITIIF
jgi:glucan 1,3-beta-glucosidase